MAAIARSHAARAVSSWLVLTSSWANRLYKSASQTEHFKACSRFGCHAELLGLAEPNRGTEQASGHDGEHREPGGQDEPEPLPPHLPAKSNRSPGTHGQLDARISLGVLAQRNGSSTSSADAPSSPTDTPSPGPASRRTIACSFAASAR